MSDKPKEVQVATPVDFAAIDRWLHDADRAEAGADFARMMRDKFSADTLQSKADHLRDMANSVDPDHTAPAWSEI